MAEAITEYFLVNTGYLQKELFIENHFFKSSLGSLFILPSLSLNQISPCYGG